MGAWGLDTLRLAGEVWLLFCHALCCYAFAARATHDRALRLCATFIAWHFSIALTFYPLALLGAFRPALVLALWSVAALVVISRNGRRLSQRLTDDIATATSLLRKMIAARWPILLALLVGSLVAVRTLRGIVSPPLSWDALTYHLPRAVEWVQSGSLAPSAAPYAWSAYEFYPAGGDIVWAWGLLIGRDDALLAPINVALWAACWLGAYAVIRQLAQPRKIAALCALLLAVTPAQVSFLTANHVNIIGLALFLCATAWLIQFLREGRRASALIALAGFACALGVQIAFAPSFALAALLIAAVGLRRSPGRLPLLALGTAVVLVPLTTYIRNWIFTGSALYPFGLTIAGQQLFAGEPLHQRLHAAAFLPIELTSSSLGQLIKGLFWQRVFGLEHVGFGPLALAVIACAPLSILIALRHRRARLPLAFLLLSGAALLLGFFSESRLGIRTIWAETSARFLTPGYAALVICLAFIRWRFLWAMLAIAIAGQLYYGLPLGISSISWQAIGLLAGSIAIASLLSWAVARRWIGNPFGRLSFALALFVALFAANQRLQAHYRHKIYRQAAALKPPFAAGQFDFKVHPPGLAAFAWPIWKLCDGEAPLNIALTAGWDGSGVHWFRYPLYGRRQQNTVRYVAPTRDGKVVDPYYRQRYKRALDVDAWMRRLAAHKIDLIVALDPPAVEEGWMRARPDRFIPVGIGQSRLAARAYRFRALD